VTVDQVDLCFTAIREPVMLGAVLIDKP